MSARTLGVAAAAATLLACADLSAQAARPLLLCALTDNLPMSAAYPPRGIDVEFARRLSERLGREVVLKWLELSERPEAAVLEGRCDGALGAVGPDAMARERMVPGLALTQPYFAAGYTLIRRPDAPSTGGLAELTGSRIAVEMESIPIYTLKMRGHRVYALDDYDAVIEAVADGRVDYGYVWGPLAAWLLRDRSDVVLEERFQSPDRWTFSVAVREQDTALRDALDDAIAALVRAGEVQRIFASYGVPYLGPVGSPR